MLFKNNQPLDCYLITLAGKEKALCFPAKYDDYRKQFTCKIQSQESNTVIYTYESTIDRKFYDSETPEFYAC